MNNGKLNNKFLKFMKKMLYIFFVISVCILFSCKRIKKTVTVIHDCTGSYLRFEGKDYPICNKEIVENIQNNTVVKATFEKINYEECKSDRAQCYMIHPYEIGDLIKVMRIR